jgi:hypothetical protein
VADHADRARKIQQRLRARAETINSRRDLSEDGRKRQLALAHRQAADEMKRVREEASLAKERRRGEIERSLFGNRSADSTALISFRDALDRVDQVKSADEAERLLNLARTAGDGALARAVALRALTEARSNPTSAGDWTAVLNSWGAENSTRDGLLTELGELHADRPGLFDYTVARPTGLTQHDNVERLAQQADQTDGEAEPPDSAAGFGWGRETVGVVGE